MIKRLFACSILLISAAIFLNSLGPFIITTKWGDFHMTEWGLAIAQTAVGQAVAPNAIDVSRVSGTDMCNKISNSGTALSNATPNAAKGGQIDARGFSGSQNCAGSMFASWGSLPNTFTTEIRLGSVVIETAVSQIIPTGTIVRGLHPGVTAAEAGGSTGGGSIIEGSTSLGFPSATGTVTNTNATPAVFTWTSPPAATNYANGQPIILSVTGGALSPGFSAGQEYYVVNASGSTFQLASTLGGTGIAAGGAATGTITATTSTPVIAFGSVSSNVDTFNVTLEHVGISCGAATGGQGVKNVSSQQGTLVYDLFIWNCQTGVLIAQKGDDVQKWLSIYVKDDGLSGNTFTCLQVGQINELNNKPKVVDIDSFACETHHTTPIYLVQLNGETVHLHNMYMEYNGTQPSPGAYIVINNLNTNGPATLGITVSDIYCDGSPSQSVGFDCIQISSAGGAAYSLSLQNITMAFGVSAWNVINDTRTNGCVVNDNVTGNIAMYNIEAPTGNVLASPSQCTNFAGGPWTFSSASVLMTGLTTGTNADFLCRSSGGTVLIQTSACTISSMRFKKDIDPFDVDAIGMINQLHPVTFSLKDPEPADKNSYAPQIGLTAEDVAALDPRLAIYEQDMVTPKSYRQEAVIGLLVAAVQQQQREINAIRRHRHR